MLQSKFKVELIESREKVIRITGGLVTSDKSEPSWLEPQLELKDFQLGSAQLVTFFPSARNKKSAKNEPKF